MNSVLGFMIGVLVYPGIVVALVAAGAFGWLRATARGALLGEGGASPSRSLGELRALYARETATPEGVSSWSIVALTGAAVLFPLLALVIVPLPGNPLPAAIGTRGDLIAETGLLLGLPATRLLLGWITPSPYTRLAADRGARVLAGVVLPLALALSASAELFGGLNLDHTPNGKPLSPILFVAYVAAGLAFIAIMPALARLTPLGQHNTTDGLEAGAAELSEISGRDLLFFRIGEALQLVAVAVFFVAVFVQPFFGFAAAGAGRTIAWLVALILTVAGLGAWEGYSSRITRDDAYSTITRWSGWAMLLSLAALVASAWTVR